MYRSLVRVVLIGIWIAAYPSVVLAQASIAGVVRDTSGAILPGVTVEAASPALIEKVRTVVTDATGQYRVVDLRPGTYSVTFTLPGFATVRREGLALGGEATFTVNVEMKVGTLEETVTVTGEAPTVDIQTVRTQSVLEQEVLSNLPSTRNYQSLHVLIPGVTIATNAQDVGGTRGSLSHFSAHGSHVRDSDTAIAGMSISDQAVGGGRSMYVPSTGETAEVTVTTSGGLAEQKKSGVFVNMVPREGGNTFAGNLYLSGANESMQGNNLTDDLRARGLSTPPGLRSVWDYEGVFGGPIKRDRLWFLSKVRYNGFDNWVPGMFRNLNEGDPTKWTYEPDLSRPAHSNKYWLGASTRLTWQVTPRNKLSVYYEDQITCSDCGDGAGGTSNSSPEGEGRTYSHPNNLGQAIWTSPVTNRLLLEGGYTLHQLRWDTVRVHPDFPDVQDLIRVQEQAGAIPGISYRGMGDMQSSWIGNHVWRATASYITGAHALKFGTDGGFWDMSFGGAQPRHLQYRLRNGVPNQLTMRAEPYEFWMRFHDFGLFAQDQWTVSRLTLGAGLRYDRYRTTFPAFTMGPSTFVPTQLSFPAEAPVDVHDLNPRLTAAYDVFGDGRTALKASLGRYPIAHNTRGSTLGGQSAAGFRIASTTNRSWNDRDRDFVPDCELMNPDANGECGPWSNRTFGQAEEIETRIDPEATRGWGVKPYNWAFDVGVQREIVPRVSAAFTYFRRWYGNHLIEDNLATTAADYTFFDLPVPNDPRLPVSGTVGGFFDVVPEKFGVIDGLITSADNYGSISQNWQGVDLTVNARLENGLSLTSGLSTGRGHKDVCEVAQQVPEVLNDAAENAGGIGNGTRAIAMSHCSMTDKLQTQLKFIAAYVIPRVDVQLSASYQGIPGRERGANMIASNALVAPLLGRDLSGGASNTRLQLLPPVQLFDDRLNLLDMRVGKILRFAGTRTQISLDIFNVLNNSGLLNANTTYTGPGGAWEIPTQIPGARLMKITAQLDF
jgi:hypothetical protein